MDSTIVSNLVLNEEFARRVLPFMTSEYFTGPSRDVFEMVLGHYAKYNVMPTREALLVLANEPSSRTEEQHKKLVSLITDLRHDPSTSIDFLVDKTEKWAQDRAVENALRKSILVLDGKEKDLDRGSIPKLLQDALAVGFGSNIGINALEDGEEIWRRYQAEEDKIALDLSILNEVWKGGVSRKSLVIFMAGINVGKSMVLCHCAAASAMLGQKVLYITLEMSEDKITERIHANMMDMSIDDVKKLREEDFLSRLARVKARTAGGLIVKEFATASAGANHFRYLINELRLKQNFVPDVVLVDYMNLCVSSRIKFGAGVNSYTYVKAIAEELRGLAVEFNFALLTATQVTRSGYSDSDFDMSDVSESWGAPATADAMIGIIRSEELDELGQLMFKQLKNRWGDYNYKKRFVVGVDMPRMKLYDVEDSAQKNVMQEPNASRRRDAPVMDSSPVGFKEDDRGRRNKFKEFDL